MFGKYHIDKNSFLILLKIEYNVNVDVESGLVSIKSKDA